MRRFLSVAVALAVAFPCSSALAEPSWHRYDDVRVGLRGDTWAGTRLEGAGSVARFKHGAGELELGVMRFFAGRLGFSFGLAFLPPLGQLDDLAYGRLDAALDAGVVRWDGPVPGALIFGAGVGGDFGRYSYAGRFYPRLELRFRLQPSAHVALFATTDVMPAAVGPDTRVFETRTEIGFAWRLLLVGFRVGHVVETGGLPERTFHQQQLGLFVGVGIL